MQITEKFFNGQVNISCELFPPKSGTELTNMAQVVAKIATFKPSYMSVTYGAGGNTVGHSVAVAEQVERNGVPCLAHLTCVNADKTNLRQVLQQLQQVGVENILALRGDIPQGGSNGVFQHANELVEFIKQTGAFCVGGAAYPEGHPEAGSLAQDIENLKLKVAAGVDFLVTQMFFDNSIFYRYVEQLHQAGIRVPVVPGIMPVTNGAQIKRICELSGTDLPENFRHLVERFQDKPSALEQAGVIYATEQIIDLIVHGFNNIHVYTMNKPQVIGGIMKSLSEIVG